MKNDQSQFVVPNFLLLFVIGHWSFGARESGSLGPPGSARILRALVGDSGHAGSWKRALPGTTSILRVSAVKQSCGKTAPVSEGKCRLGIAQAGDVPVAGLFRRNHSAPHLGGVAVNREIT